MTPCCHALKDGIARTRFALFALFVFLAFSILYGFAGRALIAEAYEGRSAPWLAGVIAGKASIPLEVYLRKADAMLVSLAALCALIVLSSRVRGPTRYFLYYLSCVAALLWWREESGEDFYHHLSRLTDICRHLETGDWYMFVSRRAAGGKGLPIYVYYSHWLGVIPYAISRTGFSVFASMRVSMFLLLALSGLGAYLGLAPLVAREWAFLGALLYASSNYVSGNVFSQSNLGAVYGACLVPFAFYALANWLKTGRLRDTVLVALTGALLLIAHPLTFINAAIGFALYAAIVLVCGVPGPMRFKRLPGQAAAIAVLLVLNSAVYLIPSIVERKYVRLHYHGLIRFRPEEFLTLRSYLGFVDFTNPGFVVTAGIVLAVLVFAFGTKGEGNKAKRIQLGACLAAIAVYVFLTLRISRFVWDRSDYLRGNQFPWRMIQPLTFFGVVCTAVTLQGLVGRLCGNRARQLTVWLFRLAVFQGMLYLSPFVNQINGESQAGVIEAKLDEYWMKEGGWGLDEYLPNVANLPVVPSDKIRGEVEVVARSYEKREEEFRISPVETAGFHTLPKFWNARYRLFVDGREVEQESNPGGEIAMDLAAGSRHIVIQYDKPGYVLWPERISLASMIVSIVLLGYIRWTGRNRAPESRPRQKAIGQAGMSLSQDDETCGR